MSLESRDVDTALPNKPSQIGFNLWVVPLKDCSGMFY